MNAAMSTPARISRSVHQRRLLPRRWPALLRALALLALGLLVAAPEALLDPTPVSAQARRARSRSRRSGRTSRGRTRRVGRGRVRVRGSSSSRGSGRGRSARQRRRRRNRVRLTRGFDRSRCDYVDSAGYCVYDDYYDYYSYDSEVAFGFSLGTVAGVFSSDDNGLRSPRTGPRDLRLGVLFPVGFDGRLWTGYGRFRIGASGQVGGVPAGSAAGFPRGADAFEPGSRLDTGFFWSLHLIGAYLPQLSDEVQLWLGGRLGMHVITQSVLSEERRYTYVDRFFLSAGPEVGVRFFPHEVGLVVWAFADLAQPGYVQITAALVVDLPKPVGGAAF